MKRLSASFAGSATKKFKGLDREVEGRLGKLKRMDVFTDDFSPPGTGETFPGANFDKRNAPYGSKHTDTVPETEFRTKVTNELHSAGDPKDQEKMDWLDEQAYKIDAPIKNPYDQFPGAIDMNDHKAEAGFDKHQTDPARLKKMPASLGPEGFHKEVEARMKRLVNATGKADNPDLYDQRTAPKERLKK